MKKIGILTFHRSINYGAYMQAYSLAQNIKNETNYEVEIIDFVSKKAHKHYIKELIMSYGNMSKIFSRIKQYKIFYENHKFLPLSKQYVISDNIDDITKITDINNYDIIIVGSDAVWNYNLRGFPNVWWLNFTTKSHKMSYAASAHGQDFDKLSIEQKNYMRDALNSFVYIGARDEQTINFVKSLNENLRVNRNCDPTILLDLNLINVNLESRFYSDYKINPKKKIIAIMSANKELGRRVRQKYGKDFTIVSLYVYNKYSDYYLYDLTPFEWAKCFSLFEIVFSQYFHGTLLSIKNNTPVISIDTWSYSEKFDGKTKDFLKRNNLLDTYFIASSMSEDKWNDLFTLSDKIIEKKLIMNYEDVINDEKKYFTDFIANIKNKFEGI